jgi:methylmalonyl-CoA mutase N-terminal domain/subunit
MKKKSELERAREKWEQSLDGGASRSTDPKGDYSAFSRKHPKLLYTPLDWDDSRYLEELGFPGEFPFTRGVYKTMYRGRPWTIRQYAGFGTAEETNARFHYLLARGQKGLSVAFDLPTQMGLDSDDPLAEGEVGRVGVAVDSLDDMRKLFDRIPLGEISTSMTINATAPVLLAMYVALADERNIGRGKLSGTIQNDILKEYIARGTYVFPPASSVRLITDTFAWCSEHLPNWNPISISGYHIREAGATAVQELAFTFADAVTYVQAGIDAGLEVDSFAPRLSFFFNVHRNFLEEIAKFRAARRLWASIMKNRFKAAKPESMRLRFHTQTAGSTLTAQQPENNIIRVSLQALAAVLGGTQSLHTNSYDEAIGLPSDRTSRIALRTQQVIMEESGVTDVIDPLGGSYFLETLTDEIEKEAAKLMAEIDDMGGMVKAIESGFPQRLIERSSYEFQKSLEEGAMKVVGVNIYEEKEEREHAAFRIDPRLEKAQVQRLRKMRSGRNEGQARDSLAALRDAAAGSGNLMPFILEAVKASATVGEICGVLADVFGTFDDRPRK